MKNYLKISEFAKLCRVSPKQLRNYHRLGLVEPAKIVGSKSYRNYRPEQKPTVDQIQGLRQLGLSLSEIVRVMKKGKIDPELAYNKLSEKYPEACLSVTEQIHKRDLIKTLIVESPRTESMQSAIVAAKEKTRTKMEISCYENGAAGVISWAVLHTLRRAGANKEAAALVDALNMHLPGADCSDIIEKCISDLRLMDIKRN